jgi:hypothetical protein
MNVVQFFQQRPWLAKASVVLGALGIGFVSGRWVAPAKLVVQEKIRVVETQKVVVQEKVRTDVKIVKVVDSEVLKKLHREITEMKRPDGTQEKKTVEDLNVDSVVHSRDTEVKVVTVDKVVEKQVERVVQKETMTLRPADWRATAGVGVSIPYYMGQGEVGAPGLKGTVVQLELARRVVGPFSVGVMGSTQGTIGLTLSGVW